MTQIAVPGIMGNTWKKPSNGHQEMAAPFLHILPFPSWQGLGQESTKCLPYLSGILSCSDDYLPRRNL